MFNLALAAFAKGLALRPDQVRLLIRTGVVLAMTIHVAWVCGWLTFAGFAAPFATAAEQKSVDVQLKEMQKSARISTQIQIQAEIREQGYIYCSSSDERAKNTASRRIDELRVNLREIAGIDEPRPVCR